MLRIAGEPPVTEEEEKSRMRRVRIFQFIVSMVAITTLYKGLKWIASFRHKTPQRLLTAQPAGMTRDLEGIFQRSMPAARNNNMASMF